MDSKGQEVRIDEGSKSPGWYDAPEGLGGEAYWDGVGWTGTTRANPRDPVDPGWIVFLRSAVWLTIFILLSIGALFLIGAIGRV
jgi:hypothetical protein